MFPVVNDCVDEMVLWMQVLVWKEAGAQPRMAKSPNKSSKEEFKPLSAISGLDKACVGKGGRYDALLARYRPPQDRRPVQVTNTTDKCSRLELFVVRYYV
jgi:hypothetical protein